MRLLKSKLFKTIGSIILLFLCIIQPLFVFASTVTKSGTINVILEIESKNDSESNTEKDTESNTEEDIEEDKKEHKHNYTDIKVFESTCTEQGYTKRVCECGEEIIDMFIPLKEHKWSEWIVDETEKIQTRTCEVCKTIETKELETENKKTELINNKIPVSESVEHKNIEIVGYVIDINGIPVPGAKVELSDIDRITFTDNKGYYEFKDVEEDNHSITIYDVENTIICKLDIIIDDSEKSNVSSKFLNKHYTIECDVDLEKISTTISGIVENVSDESDDYIGSGSQDPFPEQTKEEQELTYIDVLSKMSAFSLIVIIIVLLTVFVILIIWYQKFSDKLYEEK